MFTKQNFFLTCIIIVTLFSVFFASREIYVLLTKNREYTSNRVMKFVDEEGNRIYSINFVPERMEEKKLFSTANKIILSTMDSNSRNYKIIYAGTYMVDAAKGLITEYFTILKSEIDGKMYFSPDNVSTIRYVVNANPQKISTPLKTEEITCYPILLKDQSEIIKRAKKHIFESLKDLK